MRVMIVLRPSTASYSMNVKTPFQSHTIQTAQCRSKDAASMTVRQARRKVVQNLIDDSTVMNINTRRDAAGMTSDKLALLAGIDVAEMKCSPYMHTNIPSNGPPSGNMHGGGGGVGNGGGNDSDTPSHTTSGGSGGSGGDASGASGAGGTDALRKRKVASSPSSPLKSRVGRMSGPVGVASNRSTSSNGAGNGDNKGANNGGRSNNGGINKGGSNNGSSNNGGSNSGSSNNGGSNNGGSGAERRVYKSLSRHKTLDDANDLMQHPTFPAVMDAAQSMVISSIWAPALSKAQLIKRIAADRGTCWIHHSIPFIHPLYTLYTPFIHRHYHIYTCVHPLYMYVHLTHL